MTQPLTRLNRDMQGQQASQEQLTKKERAATTPELKIASSRLHKSPATQGIKEYHPWRAHGTQDVWKRWPHQVGFSRNALLGPRLRGDRRHAQQTGLSRNVLVGPGKRRAPPARHETLARDLGWLAPASAAPLRRAAQDVPPIIHSAHFYQPNRTTSIYIYCKIYKLPVLGCSWPIARLYRLFQSF